MNKHELIKAATESEVAKARNMKQADITAAVDAVIETIETTLSAGEAVQVVGFLTLKPKAMPVRNGYDPINKVAKVLDAKMTVKASAGQRLKTAVQGLNPSDFLATDDEAAAE